MPTAKSSNPQKLSLMSKQLAVKMEKVYDLRDGSAEKYRILAYLKEEEAIKQKLLQAATDQILGTVTKNAEAPEQEQVPMSLSQQVTLGITSPQPANVTNVSNDNRRTFTKEIQQTIKNISVEGKRVIQNHDFTVTDLLLSIIAFFLFILIIIHD